MSKIDYQALREAAEKATWGDWDSYKPHRGARGYEVRLSSQAIAQHVLKNNAEFIAAFNPKIALALLDERERNQQYIKRRDQENEEIALTVGKLRVELEGKDSKIANLTAERDALREGEMGDARHSNTRAAADIYFQLVEECEIPAGGSLVEYVDDMRENLEAAEKRIAELESLTVPQLPQQAVPDEMPEPDTARMFFTDAVVAIAKVQGWNACRAAMLHSAEPVSQAYKLNALDGNSPVTPDGWVMVPKELTPEMVRAVQIRSELGGYATSNLSGAYNMFSEFWNVAVSAAPKVDDL